MTTPIFQTEIIGKNLVVQLDHNLGSFADVDISQATKTVEDKITANSPSGIVIDFASVAYFGSGILEAICVMWNQLSEQTGRMVLCNLEPVALEIIQIANFDTLWPIFETREAALASLGE
jgi:anti-anti-sigma factor